MNRLVLRRAWVAVSVESLEQLRAGFVRAEALLSEVEETEKQ